MAASCSSHLTGFTGAELFIRSDVAAAHGWWVRTPAVCANAHHGEGGAESLFARLLRVMDEKTTAR
jgi:hypothetical protein